MPAAPPPPRLVDSVGKPCPVPVIDLARAVQDMALGDEVDVRADDPGAATDIPVWCRMRNQTLVSVCEQDGIYTFRVRRTS